MKALYVLIVALLFTSCANLPVSFGLETNGVNASYSAKGGLVIDIDPSLLVDQSSGK